MTVKKKVATVTKRSSIEDKLNALRFQSLLAACQTPYGQLSNEWLKVFELMDIPEKAGKELCGMVDKAMSSDAEKLKC
jgi:hypothetical protein